MGDIESTQGMGDIKSTARSRASRVDPRVKPAALPAFLLFVAVSRFTVINEHGESNGDCIFRDGLDSLLTFFLLPAAASSALGVIVCVSAEEDRREATMKLPRPRASTGAGSASRIGDGGPTNILRFTRLGLCTVTDKS